MDNTNKRFYDTYRLNLDNSRLVGISILLIIFLSLSFLAGFSIGRLIKIRDNNYKRSENLRSSDTLAFFSNFSATTQFYNYEFYRSLPKERLTEEDLQRSIPYTEKPQQKIKDKESLTLKIDKPQQKLQDKESITSKIDKPQQKLQDKESIISKIDKPQQKLQDKESIISKIDKPQKKSVIVIKEDINSINNKRSFSLQVSSFKEFASAESLENKLKIKSYPAYIIKARINGILYFRVRVGPYLSLSEALIVLERLREKEGFSGAYLCKD